MVEINWFPDPKLQVRSGASTILARNYFPNPSPVSSLTGFSAVGSATITRDSAVAIKGAGGATVVSSDGSSGVAITLTEDGHRGWVFSAYVRAHAAMTITGSGTSNYILKTYLAKGWGDFGWGEAYSYVEGASHTFAAGEVKRFRIAVETQPNGAGGGDYVSGPIDWSFKLLGTGTFDVDAVWLGDYVDDGVDPVDYPGGAGTIPDAELYFDGAKTGTTDFTYEWEGTPYASISRKLGHLPKYIQDKYPSYDTDHQNTFTLTLPGGETGAGMQSAWEYSEYNACWLKTATGSTYSRDFLVEAGAPAGNYILSLDVVSLYENYIEGYIGGLWDNVYLEGGPGADYVPMVHPLRHRLYLPLPNVPADDPYYAALTVYRDWVTGVSAFTSVALNQVDFIGVNLSTGADAASEDLLAYGMVPGNTYHCVFLAGINSGKFYRIEYQTGGGGSWTSLVNHTYDAAYVSEVYNDVITIPSGVTALRLVSATDMYFTWYSFTSPPEYFDGDTPDGGGFQYSWTGTPGESPSMKAPANELGRVFIGGVGIPITAIKVVRSGTLQNVTAVRKMVTVADTSERDALVPGDYQPGPTTTGVVPGISLTPYNTGGTTLTLTTPNQVFQNLEIYGDVAVQAAGLQFLNCKFHGGLSWPTSQTAIIDCRHSSTIANPPLLVDCTIAAARPSYYRDGIMGNFTARRCDISHVNDGMGIYNTSTTVGAKTVAEANWVHDLVYWYPEPAHTDGTHNDCIQIQSGGDIHVIGNFLQGTSVRGDDSANSDTDGANSGGSLSGTNPDKPTILTQANGPHINGGGVVVQRNTGVALSNTVIIEKNYFSNGLTGLNLKVGTYIVQDNRFHRASFYMYSPTSQYPIRPTDATVGAAIAGLYTTNRYIDNGEVLTEANGGIRY